MSETNLLIKILYSWNTLNLFTACYDWKEKLLCSNGSYGK